MIKALKRLNVPADQIIFAIPAGLYLATPLLDIFINYFRSITGKLEYETFKIIPYLPIGITVILALSLILFFIKSTDKNIFRVAYRRTYTFQNSLLLFILYLGLVLISIAANGFTYYAVYGHPYTKMSMWTYITNVLLYLFFSSLVYDEKVKSFLVRLCCYSASAYALYGVLAHIFKPDGHALSVTFHNSNHYGYYLAVSIALTSAMIVHQFSKPCTVTPPDGEECPPTLLNDEGNTDQSEKKDANKKSVGSKWIDLSIWSLMLIMQCIALAYNNTLGAWLAVLFSQIFLFVVYRVRDGKINKYILYTLGLFVGASIVCSIFTKSIFTSVIKTFIDIGNIASGAENADKAGSGRWKIWKWTVRHILDRPLIGNGIEGILQYTIAEDIETGSPHNEFLEYAAFFGIPAALAYIAGCVSVFLHGLKYRKQINALTLICMAGAISYLASSFFGVCFYYTIVYNFIFLGLSLNFVEKDRMVPVPEQVHTILPEDITSTSEGEENIQLEAVQEGKESCGAKDEEESTVAEKNNA